MANTRKYGYFKPVKKNVVPIRRRPGKEIPCGKKEKTGPY